MMEQIYGANTFHSVACKCCNGVFFFEENAADAIKAWNTRAERTCEPVRYNGISFRCSVCGSWRIENEIDDCLYSYCPGCGARVIGEWES